MADETARYATFRSLRYNMYVIIVSNYRVIARAQYWYPHTINESVERSLHP